MVRSNKPDWKEIHVIMSILAVLLSGAAIWGSERSNIAHLKENYEHLKQSVSMNRDFIETKISNIQLDMKEFRSEFNRKLEKFDKKQDKVLELIVSIKLEQARKSKE